MKDNLLFYLNKLKTLPQDNLLKKIMKNSGVIFFGNSTASLLGFISFTIMAKQMGAESLAILALAQTYTLIINDMLNVQTWESMIKFGSREFKKRDITKVVKTNFVIDIVSAIIASVVALLMVRPTAVVFGWNDSFLDVLSLYSLSILFNITTFTIGIPRLFDRFMTVAKINVTVALIKLLCVLYAMYFTNSFIIYIYIYLFADILMNLSLIIYSMSLLINKFGVYWWIGRFQIDKDQLRFIWWTNLRTVIRIPVRHFDMVVISAVMPFKMIGIYKVYKEIAGLIERVGEPINQSIFPEFTKLLGNNEIKRTAALTKKTMVMLTGAGAAITLPMLIASEFLVGIFFGKEYLSQIYALYLLMILYSISFFTLPINSLFIAAGFARDSVIILILTNSVYLVTAFSFGRLMGIYGIILAFGFQLILNKGLKIFLLQRYSHDWGLIVR